MCPPADPPVNGNGQDEEMVLADVSENVKSTNGAAHHHGQKKGFYARPSDFLSNTSNWKVSVKIVGFARRSSKLAVEPCATFVPHHFKRLLRMQYALSCFKTGTSG